MIWLGILFVLAAGPAHAGESPRIRAQEIGESSGVVASRRHVGVLWTHNDSGNPPTIYAIDATGRLLASYRVNRDNRDWEDIAIDDAGHLYIGEIGNNDAKRDELLVYRLPEPDPSNPTSERLEVDRTWKLRFSGPPFDCESLFIWRDHGYVIAKRFDGSPASLWRFSLSADDAPQTLAHVCDLPVHVPVTGADISPDGSRLVLCTAQGVCVFLLNADVFRAGTSPRSASARIEPSREAVCFVPGGVLTTSEKRAIDFFPDSLFDFPATQPSR